MLIRYFIILTAIWLMLSFTAISFAANEHGVYFYRTPQSLFPSGQANQKELEKYQVRKESNKQYLIEKDGHQIWLKPDIILRDIDLSLKLNADGIPIKEDLGFAENLISTVLRDDASWTSNTLAQIKIQTHMSILNFVKGWVQVELKVKDELLRGYVDIDSLILKIDFAGFVLVQNENTNDWLPVKYREGDYLLTEKNERIPLNQIKALITRPELGIVIERDDKHSLTVKNRVIIRKFEDGNWNVSQLKGHGEVYWKYEEPEIWHSISNDDFLFTEDLLKREIFSVAFHPQKPNLGIVSSQGIFVTTDGEKWHQLKKFGDHDFPVAINSQGNIVVGPYISHDFNEQFEPFLRWENLTKIIENQAHRSVPDLKLKNVSFLKNNELKVQLEAGGHLFDIKGHPENQNSWRVY